MSRRREVLWFSLYGAVVVFSAYMAIVGLRLVADPDSALFVTGLVLLVLGGGVALGLTALSIRDIAGPHAPWAIMGLLVLLFLAVVWPTPFEYHVISKVLLRVNRLTGDVRMVFP